MVRNPVTAQAPIRRAGELVSRAISAETMKMPEPIIEPMTSMVELVKPSPLTNSRSDEGSVATGSVFTSVLNKAPNDHCLKDFTLERAKIPLPILRGQAPDRILQPLSPPRLRPPTDSFAA